jgi:hypothetical protein
VAHENKPGWIQRPDIAEYIIDCYAGTEQHGRGGPRRVFVWKTTESKMGNAEAFALHLIEKFGLIRTTRAVTVQICALLVELGERMKPDTPKVATGLQTGRFREPEPEEWVIGEVDVE